MKKRLAFLSLGLVVGLAGVATASAFLYGSSTSAQINGGIDTGLVLEWGASNDLPDINNLVYGSYVTQELKVAKPIASTTMQDMYAAVEFSLSGDSVSMIKVEISDTEWGQNAEAGEEGEAAASSTRTVATIGGTGNTDYTFYTLIKDWGDTEKTYFIRYSLISMDDEFAGASLTVKLGYAETNDGTSDVFSKSSEEQQ